MAWACFKAAAHVVAAGASFNSTITWTFDCMLAGKPAGAVFVSGATVVWGRCGRTCCAQVVEARTNARVTMAPNDNKIEKLKERMDFIDAVTADLGLE